MLIYAGNQIPGGLKPEGMTKMKALYGTAEAVPFQSVKNRATAEKYGQ
jgi:hypothetical protein